MRSSRAWRLSGVGAVGVLAAMAAVGCSTPVAGAEGSSLTVSTTFAEGTVGAAYAGGSVSASGGSGTYSFRASGLPKGVKASRNGALSGAPTTAGDYTVTVSAIDTSKSTKLTGSTTATLVVSPGQPTATLEAKPTVVFGADETVTGKVGGTAKGQPDTGAITFTSNGDPISCTKYMVRADEAQCTFNSDILIAPGGGSNTLGMLVAADQDYLDAACAAGQVAVYK